MPRRPRSDLTGFPLHVIQRGNNRSACFLTDADRATYMHWLGHYAEMNEIKVHAWALMDNHVHLLITPPTSAHASRFMQSLGRRYVRHVNDAYQRTGTLWEGRFRACAVHAEDYLFTCMRYIELNPVRAGMVVDPSEFRWSSYRTTALGIETSIWTAHSLYTALGSSPAERQYAYRAQFVTDIEDAAFAHIRSATGSGHLLANRSTVTRLEREYGQPLGPSRIGRPRKAYANDIQKT
jgi:putative transposase